MRIAARLGAVTGVLVFFADGFYEAHRLQDSFLRRKKKFHLIAQVSSACLGAGRIVGVVIERLMMILEELVGAARKACRWIGIGIAADGASAISPAGRADIAVRV